MIRVSLRLLKLSLKDKSKSEIGSENSNLEHKLARVARAMVAEVGMRQATSGHKNTTTYIAKWASTGVCSRRVNGQELILNKYFQKWC